MNSPSPPDRIAQLEREIASLREELAVQKAVAEQLSREDKALHDDANIGRQFRRLVLATMEGR